MTQISSHSLICYTKDSSVYIMVHIILWFVEMHNNNSDAPPKDTAVISGWKLDEKVKYKSLFISDRVSAISSTCTAIESVIVFTL